MIILEGPDNAGKTTLASQIASQYAYSVKHSPGPHEASQLFEWCLHWLFISRTFRGRLLFDRFPFFSEQVYGPILRGGPCFSSDQFYTLQVELMRANPLIIFCTTFATDIRDNSKTQMAGVVEHYEAIYKGYAELFAPYSKTHGWFAVYDYRTPELVEGVFATIEAYHEFMQGRLDGLEQDLSRQQVFRSHQSPTYWGNSQ